ncbi:excinuclease ABC subunit UvrB [Cloacibacillus porcorum]|uniref:excinuclease ABC subunit UvrB n=1 Tax=Cloacibacillus porcorum TaxID=1197717 RepID=UPI001459E1A6|nr:excinuclease ABC subunit UvrB [Cloacibacillus porcorum]MCC8183654.1 excinuclease ABC subunit UvrB [Cloacibacillus porcorum]MCD8392029.1 excinuclease ABC subunit UvrB [Cloacibacillus porcorum]MDY5389441.1 excinuclease ABC subunit UvrB [Cloacibacillus porcorum]NMF17123.1 excinuclease ABC subunit UvrB [Cloacibacillus porcorum]
MTEDKFKLVAPFGLSGDQPQAVEKLVRGFRERDGMRQTLLGVTGSGKTFTMANVIAELNRPTLVMAHNKTLAAQLYSEFKEFFPENSVNYFVSYYDYYQPEAYIPASDVYIEKDSSVNERIEKLRLATTKSLLERRDVIVVASVSCIYGLGKRKNYEDAIFRFAQGERWERRAFMLRLIENYYERNDVSLVPGTFRSRGETMEIFPAYSDTALRISFFDDEIERIDEIDPVSGKSLLRKEKVGIFPSQHYVTSTDAIQRAAGVIEQEMEECCARFTSEGKYLEAERLKMRTKYDLEMLLEVGYCSGIENYSRYLDGREEGDPPGTLLDFFPRDALFFIDESHMTLPQVRGMYNGDRARKEVLVQHGFRLPSCLDNRPLRWDEYEPALKNALFISATPGDYEFEHSDHVVEQLIRPTGIPDPEVEVHKATGQVDDLLAEIRPIVDRGERVLVSTLTKRSAEDLAEYMAELGIKVRYIHSELDTFERAELLRDLRLGVFAVLVGVNLLREGIDLPEVSLVAILDADREGYLRAHRSLIQMIGRAARNSAGKVILYADRITDSMDLAMKETARRRVAQSAFNEEHHIEPKTIIKSVKNLLPDELLDDNENSYAGMRAATPNEEAREQDIQELERRMWEAVEKLDFETAAQLRDDIQRLKGGNPIGTGNKNYRGKAAQPQKHKRRYPKK